MAFCRVSWRFFKGGIEAYDPFTCRSPLVKRDLWSTSDCPKETYEWRFLWIYTTLRRPFVACLVDTRQMAFWPFKNLKPFVACLIHSVCFVGSLLATFEVGKVALKMLRPRNPPNRKVLIPWYKFRFIQNSNLNLHRQRPRNLSFWSWWISGMFMFVDRVIRFSTHELRILSHRDGTFICVSWLWDWLIHVRDMTHLWQHSFMRVTWLDPIASDWLISCLWHHSVRDVTHSWQHSFMCVTWPYSLRLTHLMSVTWLSSRCDLFICVTWLSSWRDSFICVTWFRDWVTRVRVMTQFVTACIHMRDMTWLGTPEWLILCLWQYYYSVREVSRSCAWHESVRDVTYSYAWHASVCDVTHMREMTYFVTRLIHMRDITRADSFMSVTCLICDVTQDSDFEKGDRPVALDSLLWISHAAVFCNVLQCVVVCCSVLHRPVALDSLLRISHVVVCDRMLQCVAVCCSGLSHSTPLYEWRQNKSCCGVWQYVAVCHSVPQCVAACCRVLQCVAVSGSVLQKCHRPVALDSILWMSHVPQRHRHVTHVNESCPIYERVMSHIRVGHFPHEWIMGEHPSVALDSILWMCTNSMI